MHLLNTLIAILGFIAVAIIACLYLVARLIEKLSGERQRPQLPCYDTGLESLVPEGLRLPGDKVGGRRPEKAGEPVTGDVIARRHGRAQ